MMCSGANESSTKTNIVKEVWKKEQKLTHLQETHFKSPNDGG